MARRSGPRYEGAELFDHLMPEEVHAILQALEDLYVKEGKGSGDLTITIEREGPEGESQVLSGFVVSLGKDDVVLGQPPSNEHVEVSLDAVIGISVRR